MLVHLNGRQRVFLAISFIWQARQGIKTKYQNPWSLIIVTSIHAMLVCSTMWSLLNAKCDITFAKNKPRETTQMYGFISSNIKVVSPVALKVYIVGGEVF